MGSVLLPSSSYDPELQENVSFPAPGELKIFLDTLYERYNTPEFIEGDPISIPHTFSRREDIEISGFFAASLAWGNRKAIIRSGHRLMERMDHAPFDFTLNASDDELNVLCGFVHRTFNAGDCMDFVRGLRHILLRYGSLGTFFEQEYTRTGDMKEVLSRFYRLFWEAEHQARCRKHLPSVDQGSACKRINMFIKWMVRKDGRGVDFGLWRSIPASGLYLPLDLHTGNMGRALGLLSRRQNDWKAVEQITASLRTFDPADPVKYDFALFGAGIHGYLKK